MKKLLLVSCVLLLVVGMFGSAIAAPIPFQIDGSSLSVDWKWGGGIVTYTDYAMPSAIDLDVGDYFDFTFGKIYIPLALGTGEATIEVDFSSPDPEVKPSETGEFKVFSIWFFSAGNLTFGAPETFGYSYMGSTGGLLELDFNDITGAQLGSCVNITGRITNLRSVPEPGTLLLLGFGLIGTAGFGRKKFRK